MEYGIANSTVIPANAGILFEYLRNVNSTIQLRDIVARENISNVSFLENLTAFLAENTGNVLFKTSFQELAGLFFNQDSFNLLIMPIFNMKYVRNIT